MNKGDLLECVKEWIALDDDIKKYKIQTKF